MTQDEAESLGTARTFNRVEAFGQGAAAVLTSVAPEMGALWEEEVYVYDFAEALRIIAASEAAIAQGLRSRSPRLRSGAQHLAQKLDDYLAWRSAPHRTALAA
jgi:hypothetical protein